ncbi:MAG: glycosyltransferase [Pseudomonadota bacterium]
MKTSVLSVTYNGEKADRLDAFFASLAAQSRPADEIVLVLDGEVRDELHQVIAHWSETLPVKLIQAEKKGLATGLNRGLAELTGEIVFRADTDDVNLPERFRAQAAVLEDPTIAVTSSPIREITRDGKHQIKAVPEGEIKPWTLYSFFRNPVNHNCCAFRAGDIRAVGGYTAGRMEDYRLWMTTLVQGKRIVNTTEILLEADAGNLAGRRGGRDYFMAEVALFKLNARRMGYLGAIPAGISFLLRAPFRSAWMKSAREFGYAYVFRKNA